MYSIKHESFAVLFCEVAFSKGVAKKYKNESLSD